MQQFSAEVETTTDVSRPSATGAHLRGRWLFVARASWIILTLFIVSLNAIMLPRYDAILQASCRQGSQCLAIALTAYDRQLVHQLGISLGFLAAYQALLDAIIVVINCALGALIFWRKSSDRMALFCAFMLVLFGGVGSTHILLDTLMPISPVWFGLIGTLAVLGQSCFLTFFLLFPSGRFVPRWTRWMTVCIVLYWAYTVFSANIFFAASILPNLVLFALLLCIVGVQVYRYRRVSTLRERQQTRWVVYGFSIGIIGFVLFIGLGNALLPPAVIESSVISILVGNTVTDVLLLLVPISIALAILRSRLYEIDVVINRTLVYGLLTGLLAAIYASLTIGLESLLHLISKQTSEPISIVISTLAIAALFQPARRRIQTLIDRRFYRQKYDREKTLATFGATLHNEVNLEQLCDHLLAVVQETMQPESVSLWLRPVEQHAESRLQRLEARGQASAVHKTDEAGTQVRGRSE